MSGFTGILNAGVTSEYAADMLRISGLKHGEFPVRYLGGFISSRKADREGVRGIDG